MKPLKDKVLIFASKTMLVAPQLKDYFEEEGVSCEYTSNIQKALDYISNELPCLVVMDTDAEDAHAVEFCRKAKKLKDELQFEVYFLADDNRNFELLWNWFRNGIDEFGTRDTNVSLICQRLQCILRRYRRVVKSLPEKGFYIDRDRYMVFADGKEVVLPRKEFELLTLLASKPDFVFAREDIFRSLWGNKLVVGDRTIDVHIRKIREKIGEGYIQTIKGVGYKFCPKED